MNQMLVAQVVVAATNRSTHHHLLLVVGVSTCLLTISLTHSLTHSPTHPLNSGQLNRSQIALTSSSNKLTRRTDPDNYPFTIGSLRTIHDVCQFLNTCAIPEWVPACSLSLLAPWVRWRPPWSTVNPGNLANSKIKRSSSSKLDRRGGRCLLFTTGLSILYDSTYCFQCRPPMSNKMLAIISTETHAAIMYINWKQNSRYFCLLFRNCVGSYGDNCCE